jgi:hypothetical protein
MQQALVMDLPHWRCVACMMHVPPAQAPMYLSCCCKVPLRSACMYHCVHIDALQRLASLTSWVLPAALHIRGSASAMVPSALRAVGPGSVYCR